MEAGSPRSSTSSSRPSATTLPDPAEDASRRNSGRSSACAEFYKRGLFEKLGTYYTHCLKNPIYRRGLGWMLLGQVGDGIMVGASGRILAALRIPSVVRGTWMTLLCGTTEKSVSQAADVVNANARDNNRAARNQRDGNRMGPQQFHEKQLREFESTRWVDLAVCGCWVAIAVGTAFLGSALWPVAAGGIVVVGLIMTWNRGRRNVPWENLRLKPANTPPRGDADMVPQYGSTIGNIERLLSAIAYTAGVAIGLAVEVWVAPVCMAASLGVVVGTLVGGCALGTVARWRQGCAAAANAPCTEPDPNGPVFQPA